MLTFKINYLKYLKLFIVAGLIIILDQIAKAVILYKLPLHSSIQVIPGFFNLTHIHNSGGAFGFMANNGSNLTNLLFLLISTLAVGFVFYLYQPSYQRDFL